MFSVDSEKTFVDKILGRREVDQIRDLIRKPHLTRSELLEVLYLMGGVEAKLMNLGAHERYILLKFFVWIREFVKVVELYFDYREFLESKGNIDPRFKALLDNNHNLLEHNVKFLIDLYLNIGRTSLSLGATGFREPLTNKFEVDYRMPNQPQGVKN